MPCGRSRVGLDSSAMLNRILRFYSRYLVLWVLLAAAAAYVWPEQFTAVEAATSRLFASSIERLLPAALRLQGGMNWFFALTMFGIGAVLTVEDFRRIARKPLIVLIGSAAQFTIMPLGAFILARAFRLPPEIAVGLVLTGSAPGAMASNVMSYVAGADTAYSVSLTTVSTLLCPLLTPGLTLALAGARLEVSFWVMAFGLVKMVIIPLLAGFLLRHYFTAAVQRILPVFPAISVTFIIFICSLVIALNHDYLGRVTALVFAAVLLLNLYGMAGGYGVGLLFGLSEKRRRTLTIEIGMQNAGLGTILALKYIGEKAAMPAAVFVFLCIITASGLAALWQRPHRQ